MQHRQGHVDCYLTTPAYCWSHNVHNLTYNILGALKYLKKIEQRKQIY